MKRNYLYRTCGVLLLLLTAACGLEQEEECLPCNKLRVVGLQLAGDVPATLETPLYIFRRAAGTQEGYVFDRSYGAVTDGTALKLPYSEIKAYDFRFLAIAQPAGAQWLSTGTASGVSLAQGTAWDDLRLVSATGSAQIDGYCGFADMSGDALLLEGSVRLALTRIAGQCLFDFYRIGSSLSEPVGVVSPDVGSVIDRVTEIEITYENPTSALRFDTDGQLVPAAYAAAPLTQSIAPALADFKAALPQADKGLAVYDADCRGSLRIEGAALLPSDSKLRVKLAFTYYDTTPACGNDHTGDHDAACYTLRQVTLDLPAASAAAGLPVAADCFTVNRAGLRCDRIIDIPTSGGIVADFGWL